MVLKFNLNVTLQYLGFKGEGIVDDRIWINKSHFPYRFPYDKEYKTGKVLVCIRNPLDAIQSLINMIGTMTHNKSIKESLLD